MTFPSALQMTATPSITLANANIPGTPTFYYNELFDADASPATVIVSEKFDVSSSWPPQMIVLPSMSGPWNIVAGHRYIFEIVASTSNFSSCSGSAG